MCRECGCGPYHHIEGRTMGRRFLTRTERVEKLNRYKEELRKELNAVEERIKELQSQG